MKVTILSLLKLRVHVMTKVIHMIENFCSSVQNKQWTLFVITHRIYPPCLWISISPYPKKASVKPPLASQRAHSKFPERSTYNIWITIRDSNPHAPSTIKQSPEA